MGPMTGIRKRRTGMRMRAASHDEPQLREDLRSEALYYHLPELLVRQPPAGYR